MKRNSTDYFDSRKIMLLTDKKANADTPCSNGISHADKAHARKASIFLTKGSLLSAITALCISIRNMAAKTVFNLAI
jgi:hypothetical protein